MIKNNDSTQQEGNIWFCQAIHGGLMKRFSLFFFLVSALFGCTTEPYDPNPAVQDAVANSAVTSQGVPMSSVSSMTSVKH
jgi:hypothetical protein